jgi:hypothetical protein
MRFLILFLIFSTLIVAQEQDSVKRDLTRDSIVVPRDTLGRTPTPMDSIVIDTLAPVYQVPMLGAAFIFSEKDLLLMNYRDVATLLNHFPSAFHRNMGFLGIPSEMSFYGEGLGRVTFLEDGINVNNRITNTLYYDNLMEGYFREIALFPSYMGFLYGTRPNQITVSVTGRDFISGAPYSRVKYFEGPVGEGFIDVQFNQNIGKRLILFTDISNNKVDDGFRNSDLSMWKGKINLKYLLTKHINLSAGYNYIKQNLGLNGGVNYDSALTIAALSGRPVNDILYDDRAAPVNYLSRYHKNSQNRLHFKAFGNIAGAGYFEALLYHQTNLNEFRENEDSVATSPYRSIIDRDYSVTGGSFRTTFDTKYFAADVHANYDAVTQESFWFDGTNGIFIPSGLARKNSFSTGGILTGKAGGFALSGFGKLFIYDGEIYTGFGGEAKAEFAEFFQFRGGVSYLESYEQDYNFVNANTFVTRLEGEIGYRRDNMMIKILGWASNTERKSVGTFMPMIDPMVYFTVPVSTIPENLSYGATLLANYSLGSFAGFVDIRYNHKTLKDWDKKILPLVNSKVGISFKDTLFDGALDLMTSVSYSYRTSTVATNYNFFVDRVFYTPTLEDVPASGQIDFFVAGTIQKVATIYFAWENLLNAQYYLSPYYPVLPRNIRFGIAWEFLN